MQTDGGGGNKGKEITKKSKKKPKWMREK